MSPGLLSRVCIQLEASTSGLLHPESPNVAAFSVQIRAFKGFEGNSHGQIRANKGGFWVGSFWGGLLTHT